MPRGVSRLGLGGISGKRSSIVEDLTNAPDAEVLGEIKPIAPQVNVWGDADLAQQIAMEEGPPPWEKFGEGGSDARQFVQCPKDWVLYWINPKMLEAGGWRGWQQVRATDPRVEVLVPSMRTPEGTVRRGGPTGDILAYMPRHWYTERTRLYNEQVARQTQSSVDRMDTLKDEFKRGTFGPNISLESAQHPTHTIADGRSMTDQ